MSYSPTYEIPFTTSTHHAEQLIRPEVSKLLADPPQGGNKNRNCENSQLLYSDTTYNVRDFISQEDNELVDKSYGDGSPNEICAFKLDQEKIDELANDYRVETCVSSSRESAIQKESYKETVKSDGTRSRNEDESRCKSNRRRKTRRKIPKGVIIELSNDVYDTSCDGIKIGVISMHNLKPEMKFITVPKKKSNHLIWNSNPRKKTNKMNKMIDDSILAIFYIENRNKLKKTRRSTKAKRTGTNYRIKSINNMLHKDVDMTIVKPRKLENTLNERRELHAENDTQSHCMSNDILQSTQCCHHDDTLLDIDNVRYPILNTAQTYVNARKRTASYCCSIFNDTEHQEYHICDREDYNADSDFNAEMRADWTAECFHPEYTHARGRRCFCDSGECDPDINMQHDHCPPMSRTARLFEDSALSRKRQREEVGSDELRTDIAPEFATKADEYSSDGVGRCTNCTNEERESTAIRKRASSEPGGSFTDFYHSRFADASRREIDTRPERRAWTKTTTSTERDDDRSYKSDSLKAADTWDAHAGRNNNCLERPYALGRAVAEPSRSDQSSPEEKGGFACGVDLKWKRGSIETDAQQLDYKWKRRIATVDADTRANVNFKGKRDSRYKSEEAIRVQLRENVKIRKRKSLQMVEATHVKSKVPRMFRRSQTRCDNTNNVDGKRSETHDYSLWASLRMGKIWSQVHDACKNVVKLVATSVDRVVKDASKSECSQRNPVEVADATLAESSSSCAGKICGETCRKNLMRSKSREKTEARQERTIGDVGKYRGDTEAPMWKNSRTITPSRRDTREHVCQNGKKVEGEKSCMAYNEYERGRRRDIMEFPPRNETYNSHENVHSQFHLSESFMYLENSVYPELRSRGGSDDNWVSTWNTGDNQKSVQCIYETARPGERYRNSTSKKCVCYDRTQDARKTGARRVNQNSQDVACYEVFVTTTQVIRANVPDASRNLHHEQTSVSSLEDDRRVKIHATSGQTRSRKKTETCEDIEAATGAETKSSFTSTIADAMVSSTEANPKVHSSRNDPNEPIASTSNWETSSVSPKKSRRNRPLRWPICAKIKFWRKRSPDNKTIASVLKRDRRGIERKEPSTAITCDSRVKITQIESSAVQTCVREGNKRRAYVSVQVQTPDAIVMRILSEFLVSGEKRRKVLMRIMLQSESDHDISDRKEAEAQTSSSDVTSDMKIFEHPGRCPGPTSKAVQCFVCDKQNCYEIIELDSSINLEEPLITEYPETSELSDLIERKPHIKIPP